MSADPLNLGGIWQGMFNYPRLMPPRSFTATLRDDSGFITGEIDEPSDDPKSRGMNLNAIIEGHRAGRAVKFDKRYDDLQRAHYLVCYKGSISEDGLEVEGIWTIPRVWSGTFLMIKPSGIATSLDQRIAETIR